MVRRCQRIPDQPNYRVTRLENGLYTVTVTNPAYTDWTEGYVYYTQDNLGKFRIEELTSRQGTRMPRCRMETGSSIGARNLKSTTGI